MRREAAAVQLVRDYPSVSVLVYPRGLPKPRSKSSYEQSYAELGRFGLDNVTAIDHPAADAIACSLIGVRNRCFAVSRAKQLAIVCV